MPTRQKKCVNCKPPNDEHGSFDRNCQTRAIEMTITRMKIDRGISYGMARKMFDERVNNQKATYADMAAKQSDDMAKSLAIELNTVKAKRQNIQKIVEETEEENNKLEEMAHRLVRAKEKQARIQEFIASMENEDQNQTHIPIMTTTTTYNKPQIKQNPTTEQTTPQTTASTSKSSTQKKSKQSTDSLIQIEYDTEMLVDLTTSTKRTRNSSDEDELPRPQTKKKETGADDRNHDRLGLEEEVSHSMGDYDVTSQDWENLSRALKKPIRTAESKKNNGKTYAYRKKGNKIEQYSPEQPIQIEQAQKFTEWLKNGIGH
jgi:hypothetical protein